MLQPLWKDFSYQAFKKLINHYNKSSIGVWIFLCVLLIAQLVINLSPLGNLFSTQLVI